MRVVVVDQIGPKVNGYFALATEIHDDSGAPHTLEHLCFMGSKSYRYKGLLDKLATRAYSTTNAWTMVEQTAYTLDTAGWDGFAQILPVYLETRNSAYINRCRMLYGSPPRGWHRSGCGRGLF